MEEFLLELIGFILDVFLEVLIQFVFEAGVAAASRAPRRFRFAPFLRVVLSPTNPSFKTLKFTLLGLGCGAVSSLVLPHSLVHLSKLHGISLLISPVITGLMMGATGSLVRRRGKTPVQIESFTCGFTFAFAFALVRILLVH
jgi:hypothetical protein